MNRDIEVAIDETDQGIRCMSGRLKINRRTVNFHYLRDGLAFKLVLREPDDYDFAREPIRTWIGTIDGNEFDKDRYLAVVNSLMDAVEECGIVHKPQWKSTLLGLVCIWFWMWLAGPAFVGMVGAVVCTVCVAAHWLILRYANRSR